MVTIVGCLYPFLRFPSVEVRPKLVDDVQFLQGLKEIDCVTEFVFLHLAILYAREVQFKAIPNVMPSGERSADGISKLQFFTREFFKRNYIDCGSVHCA